MPGGTDGKRRSGDWISALLVETQQTVSAVQSREHLAPELTAALVDTSLCHTAWVGTADAADEGIAVVSLHSQNHALGRENVPEATKAGPSNSALDDGSPLVLAAETNPEYRALLDRWGLPAAERTVTLPLDNGESSYGVLNLYTNHDVSPGATARLKPVGQAIADRCLVLDTSAALERERERLETVRSRISHDFGNPLNIASGRLELVAEECASEHIDHAIEGVSRVDTLAEETVRFVEAGQPVATRAEIPLETAAQDAWQQGEPADATLEVTDGTVRGDPERLDRLYIELFDNAIVHTDGHVRVRVGPLTDGRGFFVADDGPGVPATERETVLELGYTTAERPGIGLTIAAEIAAAHGWRLSVGESQEGGARVECRAVGQTPRHIK